MGVSESCPIATKMSDIAESYSAMRPVGKHCRRSCIYTDYVECARQVVPRLQERGCDHLVALTHMRMPNNLRLASEVPELHLVLGPFPHSKREHRLMVPILFM